MLSRGGRYDRGDRSRRVPRCGGATEVVEPKVEPLVCRDMECVILVAKLFGGDALLERLRLGRGPVFVGSADVEGSPVASALGDLSVHRSVSQSTALRLYLSICEQ